MQPQLLRELVPLGETRRYREGTVLIHEADPGDRLFVVVEGRVKVYCTDEFDKEITFGVIGSGDYFGEMALDGGPRPANVVTLETTVCTLLTRTTLLDFIGDHPEFALDLLSKVIRRARMATTSARNLAFVDVYGRLSQCLHNLAPPARRHPAHHRTHYPPRNSQSHRLQSRNGQPDSERSGARRLCTGRDATNCAGAAATGTLVNIVTTHPLVFPAQAGNQCAANVHADSCWIPACAEMAEFIGS